VFALASGWAAARIVYTELAQSRREAATDRAAQAQAYRSLFSERASEHADFTTAMTDRLVRRDHDVAELETAVVDAEKRAIEAEGRVQRESRRANQAQERVHELTERVDELEQARAEQADELATWHSDLDVPLPALGDGLDLDMGEVANLIAWEERVATATNQQQPEHRHA
jgi:chromosome segregation ATPase